MKILIFVLSVLILLGGCVVAPFIQSARDAGVTAASREALLPERIQVYTNQLASGKADTALAYVDNDAMPTLAPVIRKSARTEKVVEGKVEELNFSASSFDAEVVLRVRYFKVPVYIVRDRIERQAWRFSMADGWKLKSISVEPEAG